MFMDGWMQTTDASYTIQIYCKVAGEHMVPPAIPSFFLGGEDLGGHVRPLCLFRYVSTVGNPTHASIG